MTDQPSRDLESKLRLVAACLEHRVEFYGSPGVLMIALDGIDQVLRELAGEYVVLGFDSFTLEGTSVHPRLDFYTDFDEGMAVPDALEAIATWPRGQGLWVEAVLGKR